MTRLRLLSLSFCLASCLTSSLASAQEDENDEEQDSAKTSESIRKSARARAEKPFGIGLGTGFFLVPTFGGEINFTYNYGLNYQFELSTWSGSNEWEDTAKSSQLEIFDLDSKSRLTQIRVKWFPSNSFYVAGGLGAKTKELRYNTYSYPTGDAGKITTRNATVSVAIGNLWSFKSGFYIGGEWLSVVVPISSRTKISRHLSASTPEMAANEAAVKDYAEDNSDLSSVGLATFQLGWQF